MATAGRCDGCGGFSPYLEAVEPDTSEPAAGPGWACPDCHPWRGER